MIENTNDTQSKKTGKPDYKGVIPQFLRGIDPRNQPLVRHLIALSLLDRFAVSFDPFNHPEGTVLFFDISLEKGTFSKRRVPFPDVSEYCRAIDPEISAATPETMARFYLFAEKGGRAGEFAQLQKYSDVIDGTGGKYLPPGTRPRRIYSHGNRDNPQRAGLKEVRLVGDVPPGIEEARHTRCYHMLHPPYVTSGPALERIALGRFAQVDPSLIEKAEKALAQYRRL